MHCDSVGRSRKDSGRKRQTLSFGPTLARNADIEPDI